MKIGEALPQVFSKTYPALEPRTQMLLAASLLRFHQIDALPIGFKPRQKKRLAVLGYSCLERLLQTDPKDYGKFLNLPCEKAAKQLATIDVDDDIQDLLKMFQKTRFGFAWVESEKLGGFASLRDLLRLYKKGLIDTDMTVGEIASPIFSLPGDSRIETVLREMFNHRFRRVFIEGRKSLVTDRRIIGYIFSTARLGEVSKNPKSLLDVNLGDLDAFEPPFVRDNSRVKAAARVMENQTEECLICEKGVITPWDLVMKPLAAGKLRIKN
ncbi:MAG: CBS domain-containing protein [Thaumarchaeota archaeon]|nr:CBS domain-containing protein [Nitrososphaerota archaeon]